MDRSRVGTDLAPVWAVHVYHPGTLALAGVARAPDRDAAFRRARKCRGTVRVIEMRPGEWIYHHRSGRRCGVWRCPF